MLADGAGAFGQGSLDERQIVLKEGGQFTAFAFKMTVAKSSPGLLCLGVAALSQPSVKHWQ